MLRRVPPEAHAWTSCTSSPASSTSGSSSELAEIVGARDREGRCEAQRLACRERDPAHAKRLGLQRRAPRRAPRRAASARSAARASPHGILAGLQGRRHLRRRVRGLHAVLLLHLRGGERGRARRQGAVIILGSGPNRIGQGIEFDYCCVHARSRAARAGLRGHHGQLQPGDRLHRLRHLRPPLLRAAHLRGRAQHHRERAAQGRHRAVRRADAAQDRRARSHAAGVPILGTSQDAIDLAEDRGALRRPSRGAQPHAARSTARSRPRPRGARRRRAHRLPGAGAAVVRARRAGHGDRLRPRRSSSTT